MYRGECNKSCSARDLQYINWFIVWCHRRFEFKLHSCIQRWVASYGYCATWVISKALSCYQPQFDETQMGWSVEVPVQFDLGFPEFTDPDYEHYATLLDGISDLDVLFADDLLKPEWPPSKRFKHCAYAEEATSAASALKDVTNHKWFGPITTLPERERKLCMVWSCAIQWQNFLEVPNLYLVLHSPIHLLTHSLVASLTALLMCPWSR